MTNEWQEFLDYTKFPVYKADRKSDTSYLGRMLIDIFATFVGLGRILTIIARGYLFHNPDGSLKDGDPYGRVEHVRDALCAWCSIPDEGSGSRNPVDFRRLSARFPELVSEDGRGWFFRHEQNAMRFIKDNPELISKSILNKGRKISGSFAAGWKKKVRQLQVPVFSVNTAGAWTMRFDDIIADAFEAGPLHMEEYQLPDNITEFLNKADLNGVPIDVVSDVLSYYLANKQEDTDWVVLPVMSFNYYYGNSTFEKKYLKNIPEDIILRDRSRHGVCRIKVSNG